HTETGRLEQRSSGLQLAPWFRLDQQNRSAGIAAHQAQHDGPPWTRYAIRSLSADPGMQQVRQGQPRLMNATRIATGGRAKPPGSIGFSFGFTGNPRVGACQYGHAGGPVIPRVFGVFADKKLKQTRP